MRIKTSITMSEDLLKVIDKCAAQDRKSRSDFIEAAVRAFIPLVPEAGARRKTGDYRGQSIRDEQDARDLEIINRRADCLNEEASDVLAYQMPP